MMLEREALFNATRCEILKTNFLAMCGRTNSNYCWHMACENREECHRVSSHVCLTVALSASANIMISLLLK